MIHNLNLTDTEYIQLLSQGYDPSLEYELMQLEENQRDARKLTRIVGLCQDKPPETDEEWNKLIDILKE